MEAVWLFFREYRILKNKYLIRYSLDNTLHKKYSITPGRSQAEAIHPLGLSGTIPQGSPAQECHKPGRYVCLSKLLGARPSALWRTCRITKSFDYITMGQLQAQRVLALSHGRERGRHVLSSVAGSHGQARVHALTSTPCFKADLSETFLFCPEFHGPPAWT